MYRVTAHILNTRTILQCRPSKTIQIKTVTRTPANFKYVKSTERETCPIPPPPPPPPPKDDKLLWGAIAALVMASGFAFYAQQTPELRDWLTLHAPWFDDLIAIAYRENMSYTDFAEKCIDDAKKYLNNYLDDNQPKAKKCSHDGRLIEEPDANVPPVPDISECDEKVEKPKCEAVPPPVITKDICEVEACLRDLGDTILNNYYTARRACAYYNELVEEKMLDFSIKGCKELHFAKAERLDLVQKSNCFIAAATIEMDDLSRYLECGVKAPENALAETRAMIADYRDKITAARMQYQWENDKSIAMDAQVAMVEELVMKYVEENQTLFAGLQYDQKKPVLQGDADLLLYHTMRYAQTLQAQLCEASSGYTERVNRAMETLSQKEVDVNARNKAVQAETKKRIAVVDKEIRNRYDAQRANNAKILKESLKKQKDRHEENLNQKLAQKEKEVTVKLNKMVAEKVAAEKKVFAGLLAEMAAKLKVVEDKLAARLKAERETRLSQELYKAGSSLLAATKMGDRVVRVDKELRAIEKASTDDDKLMKTVLKSIPDSIRKDGLVPESVLRERYHKMEKAALAVALVESDGAAMPVFILSWFQSLMLFMKLSCIPQAEIDKPPSEPFKNFDTFDLLRRARYYIERGNLAAAVRYVSSLEGASRAAAETWYEAARSHLATRQAAEAVLAHAAALALQHI